MNPVVEAVDADFLLKLWGSPDWARDSLQRSPEGYVYSPWVRVPIPVDTYHQTRLADQYRLAFAFSILAGTQIHNVVTHNLPVAEDPRHSYLRFSTRHPQS